VKPCSRPLDPIDAEAVAAGAEPVFAADAAAHARVCASCQTRIVAARALAEALEAACGSAEPIAGLAERVTRLRAFSGQERRTYALWNAPVLLTGGLFLAGLGLLVYPYASLTASEQVSLGALALAPLTALARAVSLWASDLIRVAPASLQALSDGMRQESAVGLAALALLAPLSLGLNRILSRAPGRR
jgi:hypothetical protein